MDMAMQQNWAICHTTEDGELQNGARARAPKWILPTMEDIKHVCFWASSKKKWLLEDKGDMLAGSYQLPESDVKRPLQSLVQIFLFISTKMQFQWMEKRSIKFAGLSTTSLTYTGKCTIQVRLFSFNIYFNNYYILLILLIKLWF